MGPRKTFQCLSIVTTILTAVALAGCSSSSDKNRANMHQTELDALQEALGEDELTPSAIADLKNRITMLMGQVATLMGRADISPADLQDLRDEITDLTGQVATLMGRADITPADLQDLRDEITDLTGQVATLMGRADITPAYLQDLRNQITALEARVDFSQLLEHSNLARNTADPIYATDADDTLATLLPDPNNRFATLSAGMRRDFAGQTSSLSNDIRVKSISSDGANGIHVTYSVNGKEQTVHFRATDYDSNGVQYHKVVDGIQYWFWDYLGSFRGPDKNQGSSQYEYFDVSGSSRNGSRNFTAYGVRTEAANMPSGTANYAGQMRAEAWDVTDPSRGGRVRMRSDGLNLTANLDTGSLEGIIRHIRVRRPGERSYSHLSDTSATFEIGDGQIVDGQFLATLTGRGDQSVPADETVLGYEGSILGEFYGPAAEEIGGALSASSDTHNRVLAGWFGGTQLDSSVPEGDLSFLSVANERNFLGSTVRLSDTAEVTAIESDDAGGFRVTYLIDNLRQEIHLEGRDYGSDPGSSNSYYERMGDQSYWLWNPASYSLVPEFDHFDVRAWAVADWAAGSTTSPDIGWRGFALYGAPTELADLPSGTASYAGRIYAETHPLDDPASTARGRTRGHLTLDADFGASTVGGMIDKVEYRAADQSFYAATNGHIMIEDGMVADSGFTADLTGTQDHADFTGDMEGQFYGPAAAEVGGVLKGTYSTQDLVLTGYFGGSKQ